MYQRVVTIGIVGTGFIGRGLARILSRQPRYQVSRVLTRRPLDPCPDHPLPQALTHSLEEFLDHSELVVECSGDIQHACWVVEAAFERGLPVVTMNAEFQVTAGSYFAGRGVLSEAQGDQPGGLADLHENALAMGFQPRVYANVKGFYDPNPTPENMAYWSRKQGISLPVVTSATDGTKIQFEQALVANGLGADILQAGLLGLPADDLESGALALVLHVEAGTRPISDYIILPQAGVRVFIVARHHGAERAPLAYLKMGNGPNYIIPQALNLTYMEIPKTIARILAGQPPLLNNSRHPTTGVAAVAKKALAPGTLVQAGVGSFEVRGEALRISEDPDHLPIGLLQGAVVRMPVEPGQRLHMDDVDLPDSLALRAWQASRALALASEQDRVP